MGDDASEADVFISINKYQETTRSPNVQEREGEMAR